MSDYHPIKSRLDRLFKKESPFASPKAFEEAGFGKPHLREPTNIVVGRHKKCPGYLFKVFLETQPVINEWECWVNRINGARIIQKAIERHGFVHFVVPKKWIYQLPASCISQGPYPKRYILVVEKMPILEPHANLKAFKSKITPKLLDELFVLLAEEVLIDSVYPDNIPFTKHGKIAFIDTEHYRRERGVPYEKLSRFLSKDMKSYWETLWDSLN